MFKRTACFLSALFLLLTTSITAFAQSEDEMKEILRFNQLAMQGLTGSEEQKKEATDFFAKRGGTDMIPTLVLMMRIGGDSIHTARALKELTGEDLKTWYEAMEWQEAHPEVRPHPSYQIFKLRYLANIDKRFFELFDPRRTGPLGMRIRFEEVTWGGAKFDTIRSLDNPKMISVAEADYLNDDDLVFGVSINGDAKAYPLRILGWHEMVNDVIGGVPVALAYCTLCGSGILFETQLEEGREPLVFGSTGLLYRSNKLMFDRATYSVWNHFTGEPVIGPLTHTGIKLKIRPNVITSWAEWRKTNPKTTVLSLETGYIRDYDPGVVYKDYFASPDLMFPAVVRDESVMKRKDYVFGIRDVAAARAWPISVFAGGQVVNDMIGTTNIVLIGDESSRTVRAYKRGDQTFNASGEASSLQSDDGQIWRYDEASLKGPNGESFARMPGHVSYWFAWDGYMGVKSSLYARK